MRRSILSIRLTPAHDPSASTEAQAAGTTVDAQFVFTRAELTPVMGAIRSALGTDSQSLDTPVRLQAALATLIRQHGSPGEVAVRRSPAALLTPEYWHVDLEGVDDSAHGALLELFRAGRS
jgi:hypothetical protein